MTTTQQTVTVLRDKEGNPKVLIFKDIGKGKVPEFIPYKPIKTDQGIAEIINEEI